MKYFNTIFRILFFSFLLSVVGGCASSAPDPADMYKDLNEQQLFQKAEQLMLKKHYEDAISHFVSLDARYPFGEYNTQGQLDMIYCYYKKDDMNSAIEAADHYLHLYPRSDKLDYVYYMRGLMRFEQHRGVVENFFGVDFAERDLSGIRQAYLDFNQLLHLFPKSQYAPDARQRMLYIRDALARYNLQIGQHYFDRKAYVAAANRASDVVAHYQGSSSVPQALVLMVKSYRQLGLTQEADQALRVLHLNYPNTKVS